MLISLREVEGLGFGLIVGLDARLGQAVPSLGLH
jgi:hypothetical protein